MADMEICRLVEEAAANAWPAPVQQQLENWKLRAGSGVTRRANSVLAFGPFPTYPDWHNFICDFYTRRQLPVRFQITCAAPEGLDAWLEEQGYRAGGHSLVQTALIGGVLSGTEGPSTYEVKLTSEVTDEWLELYLSLEGGRAAKREVYRQIAEGVGPAKCFALARKDGRAASVALSVAERGWAGLFSVATAVEARRQGASRAVLNALARWASRQGADHMYLQVLATNEPALNLYRKLGFTTLSTYHYREK